VISGIVLPVWSTRREVYWRRCWATTDTQSGNCSWTLSQPTRSQCAFHSAVVVRRHGNQETK